MAGSFTGLGLWCSLCGAAWAAEPAPPAAQESSKTKSQEPTPEPEYKPFIEWETLTGSWAGGRTTLSEYGFDFELVVTGEVGGNVSGGIRTGASYLANFDLVMTLDADKLMGWPGASFKLYALGNAGSGPSALIGDSQVVSNIDTSAALKVYEVWLQQEFLDGAISLLFGLFDLNSEFDTSDTRGLFLSSSHGIGPDIAQAGANGPSIFPATSLAGRLRVRPIESLYLAVAVFDGVPGDPARPARTHVELSEEDGALVAVEVGYQQGGGDSEDRAAKIALGGWYFTGEFDTVAEGAARQQRGNFGVYALGDCALYREAEDSAQGLAGFLRLGLADDQVNQLGWYLGAGLVYTGLFPSREEDQLGLAVAAAFNGEPYLQASRAAGTPADAAEVSIELSYRFQILPWLAAQPDLQWVINPGTDPTLDDALFLGARLEVEL